MRLFSPHKCEHGFVVLPYYHQTPLFVWSATRDDFEKSLALLRANPPDSYYDCGRSSADSCVRFVSIDQPRLSTSSDQLYAHLSGPQDMATDFYRQIR